MTTHPEYIHNTRVDDDDQYGTTWGCFQEDTRLVDDIEILIHQDLDL